MNPYQLGLALPGRSTARRTGYQAGLADAMVGVRLGNFPGWLLDQIRIMDSDLITLDSALLAELGGNGCHLGVPGLVYPASASTVGDAEGEAGAKLPAGLTDDARLATQPAKCVAMAAFYDGPWRTFLASWSQWADGKRGHGLKGWYERFWGWEVGDTITQFRDQLLKVRQAAVANGFNLEGVPMPSTPATGLFDKLGRAVERTAEGAGNGLADILQILKWLAYAAIGVGVILALGFVFRGGWAAGGGRTLMLGAGAGA